MTRPLAACQCARAQSACTRTATQEDLRCDVCRAGCSQVGFGTAGAAPEDIKPDGHHEIHDFGLVIPDAGAWHDLDVERQVWL